VPPTFVWRITKPDGTLSFGIGPAAGVTADQVGTYTCRFTARANRECQPNRRFVSETGYVPDNYETVGVVYKTFIAPEAIQTSGLAFWLWPYYKGDGRRFGGGTSRSSQSTSVTVDPRVTNGQVGTPTQGFGTTVGYDNDPEFEDVFRCEFCPVDFDNYDDFCLTVSPSADCTATAVAGQNGNVLSIQHSRVDDEVVQIQFDLVGYVACSSGPDPAIDAHIELSFRQECENGVLQPMEFMLVGNHDGFPWHELYIKGVPVYEHDPCCTREGPGSLVGSGEWPYSPAPDDPPFPCHPFLTGIRLSTWQPLPGLDP